jgi:hypothetical protein
MALPILHCMIYAYFTVFGVFFLAALLWGAVGKFISPADLLPLAREIPALLMVWLTLACFAEHVRRWCKQVVYVRDGVQGYRRSRCLWLVPLLVAAKWGWYKNVTLLQPLPLLQGLHVVYLLTCLLCSYWVTVLHLHVPGNSKVSQDQANFAWSVFLRLRPTIRFLTLRSQDRAASQLFRHLQ